MPLILQCLLLSDTRGALGGVRHFRVADRTHFAGGVRTDLRNREGSVVLDRVNQARVVTITFREGNESTTMMKMVSKVTSHKATPHFNHFHTSIYSHYMT